MVENTGNPKRERSFVSGRGSTLAAFLRDHSQAALAGVILVVTIFLVVAVVAVRED